VFSTKLGENIVSLVQKIQKFETSVLFPSLQASCSMKHYLFQSLFHIHNPSIGVSILQGQNVLLTYQKAMIRLYIYMKKYKTGQSLIPLYFSYKTGQSLITLLLYFSYKTEQSLIPLYFSYKTGQLLITLLLYFS
jgi:hypothetical protein